MFQIIEDHNFDITDQILFPNSAKKWKAFGTTLTELGLAETDHKEEVPAETLEKIYDLLSSVVDAIENRGDKDYYNTYLSKIPPYYHNQLHRVLQWGAAMMLIFFEVRRGKENLDEMKHNVFKVIEDETYEFKYIKKFKSEADKNHPMEGTNTKCSGVLPFINVGNKLNPGHLFELDISFLPEKSTIPDKVGGWLFPRPRKESNSLNIHNPGEMNLFEPNQKG